MISLLAQLFEMRTGQVPRAEDKPERPTSVSTRGQVPRQLTVGREPILNEYGRNIGMK